MERCRNTQHQRSFLSPPPPHPPPVFFASLFCCVRRVQLEGMVGVQGLRCGGEECFKRACFGFPNTRPGWCVQHREEGMINLKSRTCQVQYYKKCQSRADLLHRVKSAKV